MSQSLLPTTLAQYHFLVTRPLAQAQPWAKQLEALGASVTLQPMLVIEPVSSEQDQRAIINRILAFDEYQKAIFISQNAVHYGLQWLDEYWPQLPIGVEFFAIGKVTAERLFEQTELLVQSATQAMNSEALLELQALQTLQDQKILIFRGQGGRDYLAKELEARGASVDYCELYQRKAPSKEQALNQVFRQTSKQAVVVVHSGETLGNLQSMIQGDDLLWLQQQPLLVPGQRVAQLAKSAGFSRTIVAENATHESMLEALYEQEKR